MKIGLLFGVISLILSLMEPLWMLYILLNRPYPLTIVGSPFGLLTYAWYLTPIFISLGIIFVSFAGLKSSEKKIDSEAK